MNTTNGNLDLSQGQVSKLLSQAAGPALQAECLQKAPVATGDIAVTSGGNLKCKHMIHVVAPHYKKGKNEKVWLIVVADTGLVCVYHAFVRMCVGNAFAGEEMPPTV